MAFPFVLAFTLPTYADETAKGNFEAFDKDTKKITISASDYSLSDEAAQVEVAVDDEVKDPVDSGMVKKIEKKLFTEGRLCLRACPTNCFMPTDFYLKPSVLCQYYHLRKKRSTFVTISVKSSLILHDL